MVISLTPPTKRFTVSEYHRLAELGFLDEGERVDFRPDSDIEES